MSREYLAAVVLVGVALPIPAFAGNNLGNVLQDGDTNHATIDQSGDGNSAGSDTNDIEQHGVKNLLSLTQSGDGNEVGLFGDGLFQSGTASTDGAESNSATIVQNSNGNSIGALTQVTLGAHATTGNVLSITQDLSDDNTIVLVYQSVADSASSNAATIRQTGHDNWIDLIDQRTTSADGDNSVSVTLTGNYNGITGSPRGAGSLKVLGASAGATASAIIQQNDLPGGAGNVVRLLITGDNNQFGMSQYGVDNSVGTLAITGLGNSVGTYQLGRHNQINPGDIVGNDNDLGVRQVGEGNIVDVNVLSNSLSNEIGIGQDGDFNNADVHITGSDNITGVSQLGNRHIASLTLTGSDNVVLAAQINPGLTASVGNTMTVSINGDGNNGLVTGFPQSFTGAALTAAAFAPSLAGSLFVAPDASLMLAHSSSGALVPGVLVQWGENNNIDISVGTAIASDDNLFAVLQHGNGSSVSATVNGTGNQFVVLQIGDDDVAAIEQSGYHNNIGLMQ